MPYDAPVRAFTLLLVCLLTGCGGAAVPAASTLTIAPAEADVVIDARFADGYVRDVDPVIEARLGDVVSISFLGDIEDQIHIHGGYDVFVPVTPGAPVEFAFVVDRLGVFAVELEAAGYLLFELDVG